MADQTLAVGLNTHGWVDGTTALLGYGDGSLRLFDVRKAAPGRCVVAFRDPHVDCVGDVVFDPQRKFFVVLGSPRFSVWRYQNSRIMCAPSPNPQFPSPPYPSLCPPLPTPLPLWGCIGPRPPAAPALTRPALPRPIARAG